MNATEEGQDHPRRNYIDYELPDITGGEDLIQHLQNLGFCNSNGFGVTGFSHTEIKNYQENMGITLTPWEIQTIHCMSHAYAAMAMNASKKDSKPPIEVEHEDDRRQRVTDKIFG